MSDDVTQEDWDEFLQADEPRLDRKLGIPLKHSPGVTALRVLLIVI